MCDPSIKQKIEILHVMQALRIYSLDLGLPGAGPRAVEHVTALAREIVANKMKITAYCAARTVESDIRPIAEIVQKTGLPIEVASFIGSSPIRRYAEGWDGDFLLQTTEKAVQYTVSLGLAVMYVTEDTTRSDPKTVKQLNAAAIECGARTLVLCDTAGHATPVGASALVKFVIEEVVKPSGEKIRVEWHGHSDRKLAIAHALANSKRRSVHAISSRHECGYRVGNSEPAIRMPVPFDANLFAGGFNHFFDHEFHQRRCSHRCCMPCRIAEHQSPRATFDRGSVELLDRLGIRTRGVFGDIHHRKAKRNRVLDGLFRRLQQEVAIPAFRITPDRTRSNERRHFDRQASLLHNLGNRPNVALHRASGAIGRDLHFVRDDLTSQRRHMLDRARPRSRKSEVKRVDTERLHQVKNFNLLFDGRIAHRRRLEPVAQRLIGEAHRSRQTRRLRIGRIPVVDEVAVHRGKLLLRLFYSALAIGRSQEINSRIGRLTRCLRARM